MTKITRARRAELQHAAGEIRRRGQMAGWSVERTAAAIRSELPQILPLEAWRLAYGWTRPQALAEIAALFTADHLQPPALNSAMLCRWEHGDVVPGPEYAQMLCRLYRTEPDRLGLVPALLRSRPRGWGYGPLQAIVTPANGQRMTADETAATLAALRESIQLAIEAEGPAGGSLAQEHLQAAVDYYALNFSRFAPGLLAVEVHRTRALVSAMLRQDQPDASRTELRRLAGWLSALVGNSAFVLADHTAALIHFGTAARLGTATGENHLICWSLGAQAMTANADGRHLEALDLARQAYEYADTPLRRAHILAWGELRSLAALGDRHRSDAGRVMAAAQDEMAADPAGERPGRFGFDLAELELHLAQANLRLGQISRARNHAQTSQRHSSVGRPGWAAATLVQARAEAADGRASDAAALAHEVLDVIPAPVLRETSRVRLRDLDRDLFAIGDPGRAARELRVRVRELPALIPVGRISDEPNGHQ